MGSLASISSFFACLVILSSCGGGSSGNDGGAHSNIKSSDNNSLISNSSGSPSTSSNTSTSTSSQPIVVEDPLWKDAGSLGNDILLLSGDEADKPRYVQKIDPSGEVKTLTPNLVTGGQIGAISLSPDKKKIVYLADQDADDEWELFILNIDGSFIRKISQKLPDSNISSLSWSPDSNFFCYRGTGGSANKYFLRKYNADYSTEISYEDASGMSYSVSSFKFNHDFRTYSYLAIGAVNSHLITADLNTGLIESDVRIDKIFDGEEEISSSGKYIINDSLSFSQKFVYNTETTEETLVDFRASMAWWLPNEDKLITYDLLQYVSIYDPDEMKTHIAVDTNYKQTLYFLWGNFWRSHKDYVFISLGADSPDELYIFSLNTNKALRLKGALNTDEKILSYQLSSGGKLLVLTDTNDLYTMEMDVTDVKNFSYLKSFNNISTISWDPNAAKVTFMHATEKDMLASVEKLDLSNGTIINVPTKKVPICLIDGADSPSRCRYYVYEK